MQFGKNHCRLTRAYSVSTLRFYSKQITIHRQTPALTTASYTNANTSPSPRQPTLRPLTSSTSPASSTFTSNQQATNYPTSITGEELPFISYTPSSNALYWDSRPVTVIKRTLQITQALASFYLRGKAEGGKKATAADLQGRAELLRQILTDLGPAFVKIGQAVSSRPDVVSPEYLEELEKLQDRIPPFSTEEAFAVLEEELGAPPSSIFSSISPSPAAAASLGQVYKGTLASDGSEVAIKVQRPGVATSIALDVYILRKLAKVVKKARKLNSDLPALLDEWALSLFKELDYRVEAENGERFKELFGEMPGVYVPAMKRELTTKKVLVMEWIEGERLRSAYAAASDKRREDSASSSSTTTAAAANNGIYSGYTQEAALEDLKMVEIGVVCSLEQMLEVGFYHADPHPGNLLKTKDGKLAYLDFGMMGSIDVNIRQGLIRATLHLVNREYGALAEDFITLGMLPSDADREAVVPALTAVFAQALKGGVNNLSFGQLSTNLGQTMYQFKFRIPSYYSLLVRSLATLEGIGLSANRDYKVLGAAYPWIARRLIADTSPELRETLRSLLYKGGRFNFNRMESLITQAVRPPGGSQNPQSETRSGGDALALLLSPRGEFVRNIMVEELAKGIDAAVRLAADSTVYTVESGIKAASTTNNPLSEAVLSLLRQYPKLADGTDKIQVDGIVQLGKALQSASTAGSNSGSSGKNWFKEEEEKGNGKGGDGGGGGIGTLMSMIESSAAIVAWFVRELEVLSPEEREEALRIPPLVGQAVSSRALARFIKLLASVSEDGKQAV